MKVHFVYPKHLITHTPKMPLGLAYLASVLEREGHRVKITDMIVQDISIESLLTEVRSFKPDVLGFTSLTPTINTVAQLASELKALNKDIPIVVGGPHPTALPERTLRDYDDIDIVVEGEGEATVKELIRALENGESLHGIKGLAFKHNGKIVRNPPRELIKDIDSIPFPAWHLLPMEKYNSTPLRWDACINPGDIGEHLLTHSVMTSRGCPGRCKFCDTHNIWKHKFRPRNAESVVEEIDALVSKYNSKVIQIIDDTFIVNKKRAHEICDGLIERGLHEKIRWFCFGRVNLVDKDILNKLKKAGCYKVEYGVESGSPRILKYIQKGITIDQVKRAFKMTEDVGLYVNGFWMMGFPIETLEDFRQTVKLIKQLNPNNGFDSFSILTPFPGSEFYDLMRDENLLLEDDWDRFYNRHNDEPPPIRTYYLDDRELFYLKKAAEKEIYRYLLWKSILKYIRNPNLFLKRLRYDPRFKILLKAIVFKKLKLLMAKN